MSGNNYDDEDVFEDACDEIVAPVVLPVAPNNNKHSKVNNNNGTKPKGFKLKLKKHKKKKRSAEEEISLNDGIEEAKVAVDLFLNNQFQEAEDMVKPLADRSIYHALGHGVFVFLKAVMTFQQADIEEASTALSKNCDVIGQYRKKSGFTESMSRMVRKADYDSYTDQELHAELCFSECLLLKAALTFCEDETLVSFVKAGLKVRTCYSSYSECWNALEQRDWTSTPESIQFRSDFESGTRTGVGAFNLMISLLPARIMKLLEFIGFQGNRESGLQELLKVQDDKDGMRQFLASFILLGYHLILSFFIGSSECDLQLCKRILDEKLEQYPDGAFFQFFKGRYHVVQADVVPAIAWYKSSVATQDIWPQFHHMCYWELYWANAYNMDWNESTKYAQLLLEQSKWSRCIYAYMALSSQCMSQSGLTEQQKTDMVKLAKDIPSWKQRIAGKSLPMEKFAIRKAERFLEQGNTLILPVVELIYAWNGFNILEKQYKLVERLFVLTEEVGKELEKENDSRKYYKEDFCLVQLMRAMCLRSMKSPLQAEECLKEVLAFKGQLKVDKYLVPYAVFELGLLLKEQGNFKQASEVMESAKNDYKDYSLQSRLHFRIHAAQADIKAKTKKSNSSSRKDVSFPELPAANISSSNSAAELNSPVSEDQAKAFFKQS